jgi:hypothetical protein
MLQPSNRLTLIDAMRPPPGFVLEAALGVTFTLDLRALLAVPAAFALAGSDGVIDDETQDEPIELLHALRANADKLTVFSQVGEVSLPPARRVFAFLERSVIPVRAPRGGVVHPKAWVVRYRREHATTQALPAEHRLRVLVASRNLTFDASWDTLVRLDEAPDGNGAQLGAIGDLFVALMSTATIPISPQHKERVTSVSAALQEVPFALPLGVDAIDVNVLGFERKSSPFPLDVDRSLILTPFVSDDFFTVGRPAPVDELVSRPESLDALGEIAFDHVGLAHAFDDGSNTDFGTVTERLSPRDPGRPLIGLHAKVFAFEHQGRARVFIGSANATGAAFTNNIEILLQLTGAIEHLGIDRLCAGNVEELGLRSLFTTYTRCEPADGDRGPTALDRGRRALAGLLIEGFIEESGNGFAVTYRSVEAIPTFEETTVHCWPLASAGNRRQVPTGEPLEARFETTMEAISGFLAFELSSDDTITQFVIPVPLHGVPEQRERLLLRALIGNAERFFRYLLALLDDQEALEGLPSFPDKPGGGSNGRPGPRGLPVLEKLMRTMRRDPKKLIALHPLVSDLADVDALPTGFDELWEAIVDVAIAGSRQST